MEAKTLQKPPVPPQQIVEQPLSQVAEKRRQLEPGTLENTRDTYEHQRKARHNPLWGGLTFGAGGIFLGAATAGIGLFAMPWILKAGVHGVGAVREANPLSLCQDIFFHKGLCENRETSAAWVHCLKEANVLQHGRVRTLAEGPGVGVSQLGKAFELIEESNRVRSEEPHSGAPRGPLSDATRDGIVSVVYDFQAASQRLKPLMERRQAAADTVSWGQVKKAWFSTTDAVRITRGVSSEQARREIATAEVALRDLDLEIDVPPEAPAWVPGQSY